MSSLQRSWFLKVLTYNKFHYFLLFVASEPQGMIEIWRTRKENLQNQFVLKEATGNS